MLRFTVIPLDKGSALVVASPRGLVHLFITRLGAAAANDRVRRLFPAAVHDPKLLPGLRQQLRQYFAGREATFDVPLDLACLTEFQRQVLTACAKIPYGQVLTYSQLARRVRRPRAARAVGNALARNPVPIVIPCHRVIAGDGSLGGYSAEQGVPLKRRLLDMELNPRFFKPRLNG